MELLLCWYKWRLLLLYVVAGGRLVGNPDAAFAQRSRKRARAMAGG